jgi:aminoglycoside phosphotransferase
VDVDESTLSMRLRHFTEDYLGSPVVFRDVSWPHGEAKVWAVERGGNTLAFLKQHRQQSKFSSELRAYRESVPMLGEFAPRLIGVHEGDAPALLLSALPGTIVADADWAADLEYKLHVRAARILRRLHDVPVESSVRPQLETKTRASLAHWMQRARAHFTDRIIQWATEQVESGLAEAPPICICHRDFGPRNWITTRDGQVGLIDFERTCIDFQYLDWSRLWMREWLQRPDLKQAFFEGYGALEVHWEMPMRQLMALPAVGGAVWAVEHNDQAFAEENRALVERLRRCSGASETA